MSQQKAFPFIVPVNWLVQKIIYTVILKAFGLYLVVSRLLVHLGRDQTALGKGERSSISIPVCMQQAAKQQSYSS